MSTQKVLGWLSAVCLLHTLVAAATVKDLRCEYLENPPGIDQTAPRLSWMLKSDRVGERQTAWRVLVSNNPTLLKSDQGDLWDSGKVESDQSVHVKYAGQALSSGQPCWWKVQVWDRDGQPTKWSEPAYWSMGLLKPSDWKGEWIGLDQDDPKSETEAPVDFVRESQWIWRPLEVKASENAPVESVYFRRAFRQGKGRTIAKATLLLSADNSFTAWVNGEEVGAGSNFKSLTSIDITEQVRVGTNILAVEAKNAGEAPNPAGLIGAVVIEYTNDSRRMIRTNDQWRTTTEKKDGWTAIEWDDSDWKSAEMLGKLGIAPWGEPADETSDFSKLSARYLRREFKAGAKLQRATAYISGLGLSELYLNGEKVSDHVLSPGLTEYDYRVLYVTHDVTELIQPGQNAMGVILGNGRYYAPRQKIPTFTRTYGYPKLLLQLVMEYADGSVETIVSDKEWKLTRNGPVSLNNEYDGEVYDARREMPGWNRVGFDDSQWQAVEKVDAPKGVLRAQRMAPIRVTEIIRPIAWNSPEPGVTIFDMGQNMVGWCRLRVQGPAGTVVTLRHAETLKDDGNLYLANIRSAQVTDTYTLKGGDDEIYEPRFTYHGFRFVEVKGYPGTPTLDSITGCVVHDDVGQAGEFECSQPLLNQIYQNVTWGVRGNYRSFPTDCPQRDERQAWLGDRSAECRGESFMFGIAPLYSKWVDDMIDGQTEKGEISDVMPPYWPLYSNNVTWPSSYVIIPGMLYEQYGDTQVMADAYDGMKRWIEFMSGFITEDGIMPRDQYGDWCVPPESPELIHSQDPARKTAKGVLGTTYFYYDLKQMARYARLLGKVGDAADFERRAEKMREAFNKKYYNTEKGYYDNGSQTACVLPLAFDMVPETEKPRVFGRLLDKIENESKGHIGTGLIGGQWLNRVLTDNGRPDVAFKIASQTEYPSWGYMIEQGATTIWELWNGDTADPAMNSGNHVMLVGDLVIWFYEYLAGIRSDPENPGFKHIIMKPHVIPGLNAARGGFDSMYGRIDSDWRAINGVLFWTLRIPANTTATVHAPTTDAGTVTIDGRRAEQAPGVGLVGPEGDRMVYQFDSGTYALRIEGIAN